MTLQSAGLLMCRHHKDHPEFFLVHPGGPFWAKKNEGVWGIPKGLVEEGEALLQTAEREFFEETGITPVAPFHSLGTVQLKSGKIIHAWSFDGSWDEGQGITSNFISIAWPPRSGKSISIPEIDRAEWMDFKKARLLINPGQLPFLDRANALH